VLELTDKQKYAFSLLTDPVTKELGFGGGAGGGKSYLGCYFDLVMFIKGYPGICFIYI